MTVYVLAQIRITDPIRYNRYRDAFLPTLRAFNGRLLVADTNPKVIEGEWCAEKAILIAFETEELFQGWMQSAEYQQISIDRRAGSTGTVILLHRAAMDS